MTFREIAVLAPATVRDGINCASVVVPVNGQPDVPGCSHMIDGMHMCAPPPPPPSY